MAALKAIALALLSALLFAAALPPFGQWWLAWFWLLPLLWSLWSGVEAPGRFRAFLQGFRRGWLVGFFTFTATLWWLGHVTAVGMVALCLYLALYPALWSGVAALLRPSSPGRALPAALALGLLWAGLEWGRGVFPLLGFPWNGAAVPLVEMPGIRALAAWSGVTGLSALPVFFMCALAAAWSVRRHRNARGLAAVLCVTLSLPAVLTLALWERSPEPVGRVEVLLVQPNHPRVEPGETPDIETEEQRLRAQQQEDEDNAAQRGTVRRLTLDGIAAAKVKPQLVVWPESALPTLIADPENGRLFDEVFAAGAQALLTGADSLTADEGSNTWHPHNCAALMGPDRSLQLHAKVHLVPFGEYLPFRRQIPLLEKWIGPLIPRDFAHGSETTPLTMRGLGCGLIPLVCFEDTIARHARKFVRAEPQLMVNITNDNWFYKSNESAIHALNARWRCVELRRPMVRASLTGVTCVIDTEGRITRDIPRWEPGVLHATVPLPPGEVTFYASHGDIIPITAGLTGLALALALIFSRRP